MYWIALQPAPETPGDDQGAAALVDPSAAWAWWALRFTPLVARVEAALLMEVSASERLFGGRTALLDELLGSNRPLAHVKYAYGATSLIAYARLQGVSNDAPTRIASGDAAACTAACGSGIPATSTAEVMAAPIDVPHPDTLPLHTLVAARVHLPTLVRLGLRNWGQLRALPRGAVVRRFGAALVDALDCAYGQRAELYPWLTLPEVFDAPLELTASVETAPALLFGARRLLAQLLAWLRARQCGVLVLELLWELDARRSNALHVDAHHQGAGQGRLELRTAQATQDMGHLARLLGEQLAHVRLPAPVLYLRLRSLQTQPLAGESLSLLQDDVRQGDTLHQMLERLSARLGADQVRCVTQNADHRAQQMQNWSAAVHTFGTAERSKCAVATKKVVNKPIDSGATDGFDKKTMVKNRVLYPTWLLQQPLRLVVLRGQPQYQGALTLLVGPQRLEVGWLQGDAILRDYYIARSSVAGLVWVYCERLRGTAADARTRWYLHGLFA